MKRENKKSVQNSVPTQDAVWNFLSGVKDEFRKISWTEKAELKLYTQVVILATLVFGMLIFCADFFIQRTVYGLDGLIKMVVG